MKKNKILYILTIIITLFTFNISVKAVNANDNNHTITLTCVYKKPTEGNKIAFQQDSQGNIYVYANESNKAATEEGWESIETLLPIYGGNLKDGYLSYCPASITFEQETYQMCTSNAFNQCTTTLKNKITLYDNNKGNQELEVSLGNVKMGAESPTYNEIAPGLRNPQSEKIETFTTNKTCDVAISECQNNDSCKHNPDHLATCYYGKDIEGEGCHIISIIFPTKDNIAVRAIDPSYISSVHYLTYDDPNFSRIRQAVVDNDGWCLNRIRVRRVPDGEYTSTYISELVIRDNSYDHYYRISEEGYNIVDPTKLQSENPDKDTLFGDFDILKNFECATIFGDDSSKKLLDMIKFIVNLVKIAIPIILIGLGTVDFAKAIFSGKEDEMKKAQGKFMKRIIIGICLFLVPTILNLILTIGNSIWGDVISVDFCGIL